MTTATTAEVITRFNDAFLNHDPAALTDLVGAQCVMESLQPAPDGTRYTGYDACLGFWAALAADTSSKFEIEHTFVAEDRAVVRWRLRFGDGPGDSVRGVNLHLVRDGKIIESLGYGKSPESVPLPE